ncbi:MAG: hypothetical protein ACREQC_02730 [Candidatus Binataceae bacterium]
MISRKHYTVREAYELLQREGIGITFTTFRGYLYGGAERRRRRPMTDDIERHFGTGHSGRGDGSAQHGDIFADSILPQ